MANSDHKGDGAPPSNIHVGPATKKTNWLPWLLLALGLIALLFGLRRYTYGSQMRGDSRYSSRQWDDVESDLRMDWDKRNAGLTGSTWENVKVAARHGWDRMRDGDSNPGFFMQGPYSCCLRTQCEILSENFT